MEYSEIIPQRLWIGGAPSRDDLDRLRIELGPDLIIMDLTHNSVEKGFCEELGIDYDDRTPEVVLAADNSVPLAKLKVVSAIIGDNVDSGRKVVLHCSLGKGRSPTCAAAYLIVSGMSAQDAKAQVAKERPLWQGADASYSKALNDLAKIMELTRG